MRAQDFVALLEGVRETGADSWVARCPSHEDRSPSLAVREVDEGKVLIHCFAGCNVGEVVAAVGLQLSDLFPEKPKEHYRRGIKKPFPAAAVLKTLAGEAVIVQLFAKAMEGGNEIKPEYRDRLTLASERLHEGMRYAR